MTARVTQQIIITGYTTTQPARVTAVAVEVIRSTSGTAAATSTKSQVNIIGG